MYQWGIGRKLSWLKKFRDATSSKQTAVLAKLSPSLLLFLLWNITWFTYIAFQNYPPVLHDVSIIGKDIRKGKSRVTQTTGTVPAFPIRLYSGSLPQAPRRHLATAGMDPCGVCRGCPCAQRPCEEPKTTCGAVGSFSPSTTCAEDRSPTLTLAWAWPLLSPKPVCWQLVTVSWAFTDFEPWRWHGTLARRLESIWRILKWLQLISLKSWSMVSVFRHCEKCLTLRKSSASTSWCRNLTV